MLSVHTALFLLWGTGVNPRHPQETVKGNANFPVFPLFVVFIFLFCITHLFSFGNMR